jgi:hypothetical protein
VWHSVAPRWHVDKPNSARGMVDMNRRTWAAQATLAEASLAWYACVPGGLMRAAAGDNIERGVFRATTGWRPQAARWSTRVAVS